MRSLGVLCRELKEKDKGEEYFYKATEVAKLAMKEISASSIDSSNSSSSQNIIYAKYDQTPLLVIANLHFSHGYYWYEQKNYEKAEKTGATF